MKHTHNHKDSEEDFLIKSSRFKRTNANGSNKKNKNNKDNRLDYYDKPNINVKGRHNNIKALLKHHYDEDLEEFYDE